MRNLLLLTASLAVWFFWFMYFGANTVGIDDANIFKVYARNLAQGEGLVYQISGQKVEGFSSLGYLLLLSLGYKLTGELDMTGIILELLVFIATVFSVVKVVNRLTGLNGSEELVVSWLLASPFFIAWIGLSQMDVGLWTLVVVITLLWCVNINENKNRWLQLASGFAVIILLIITRPEGMMIATLLPFAWFVKRHQARNLNLGSALLVGGWLITVLAITIFRLSYFGWPLPNTFYAKVSPDLWYRLIQGLEYFASFVGHNLVALVAIFFMFGLIKRKNQSADTLIIFVLSIFLLVIPIFNGGDHFAGFRMYQPLWPILGITFVRYLERPEIRWLVGIKQLVNWRLSAVGLFLLILITQPHLISRSSQNLSAFAGELTIAQMGRQAGEQLNQWFGDKSPRPVVGVITAGGFALTYRGETYDLLGLNEPSIAHDGGKRKGMKNHASLNPQLIVQKLPDVLFPIATTYGQVQQATDLSQLLWQNTMFAKQLLQDQQIKDNFRLVFVTKQPLTVIGIHPSSQGLVGYVSTKFIDQLQATHEYQLLAL